MNLTDAQLQLLRSQPHRTNLWLSIYRPNTLMTAQVTGTYSVGDRDISFYNSSGSYLDLYSDITVKVGTSPNSDDVGRLRMREATSTVISFAENAINWNTGMYLTFLDYVTPEAIYPRIIQDPNNAENVIFYKDYDIPYTNENTIYGTFPCAGPHRAGFITGSTTSFYYTATGTYNVADQSLTYSWNFGGGNPTGSTSLTPGNVVYSTPGHYKTRLRVTAANGAIDDTFRYVSVYNRPGEGSNTPILRWELQELSGSRNEGGYTASFKLYENIGEVEPNALVVIFADEWFGGTKTNIGGNASGNSSIVFVGYILSDTIRFNYRESSVEFQVGSISEAMKQAEGFSVSCESKASPSTWFELYEMTVPKAMYHYLRWHSTVLKVTDFQYTGDNRLVQYFDSDRGSLYDAVDSFMRDGMLGRVTADRQGKLWAEINSFGLETPFSDIPHRFTFHKQDWIGSPVIQERRNSDLSFIELGGIAYYGAASNSFSALLANAPSTVPLYHGKSDRNDGLILISQQHLNQVSGNYLAHHNTPFPDVNLSLAGTYLNLDIAPIEQTRLVIDANDSVRGKSIQYLRYIVDSMEWSYDSRRESFRPEVTLLQIATGTAGVTVQIPAVPPDGGFGYPEIDLPPLPEFGGSNPVGATTPTKVVIHDTNSGFLYSENFDGPSPSWRFINAGLTQAQYQSANRFIICPNGVIYCAFVGSTFTNSSGGGFIARAPYVGGMWTVLYSADNLSSGANRWGIHGIGYNPLVSETVGAVIQNGGDASSLKFYLLSGASATIGASVTVAGYLYPFYVSFGDNKWMCTSYWNQSNGGIRTLPVSAGSVTVVTHPADAGGVQHIRAGGTDKTFHEVNAANTIYLGLNNAATLTAVTSSYKPTIEADGTICFACSPDGGYIMTRWNGKGKSSDGGYTWGPIPSLPAGNWWFDYAGPTSRFVAAGGTSIRFSPDFGNNWMNKEGDVTSSVPIPDINMIKVVGNG